MAQKILDPHMWNLETLFELIYEVPVYQRPYSWDKEQIEVLLTDISEAFNAEDREDGYYTGNIIVYDINNKVNGRISRYDIIDGQQRITTFSLILLVVYSLALISGVSETDLTLNRVLSVKLDEPAPCRLDAPDLDLICYAYKTMKEFCLLRAESIRLQLNGNLSTKSDEQDSSNQVDASGINIRSMGSQGGGREDSAGGFGNMPQMNIPSMPN